MDDGGYLITGQAISEGGFLGLDRVDLYLARVDAGFNVQWSKTYGGPKVDEGLRIEAAAGGGYIVLGSTDQQSVLEGGFYHTVLFALLMKIDASGEVQWSQKIEEGLYSSGYNICTNPDGTIAVAVYVGYTFSSGNEFGESEVFLIKFDGDGRELWRRAYRAGGFDNVKSVSATADGGYILAGRSGRSAHIVKVDADGRETWQLTTPPDLEFGDLANLFDARKVIQTSDGGFAFVCRANTYYESAILKLDETGVSVADPYAGRRSSWAMTWRRRRTEQSSPGEASPNTPGIDKRRCARLYAVRIAADGNILWSEKLGGNFSSVANGVALDAAGNAVLAGSRYEAAFTLRTCC